MLQSAHAFLNLSTFANLKYPDIEAVVVDWANNMKDDEMHPKCKEELIVLRDILQYEVCMDTQKKLELAKSLCQKDQADWIEVKICWQPSCNHS